MSSRNLLSPLLISQDLLRISLSVRNSFVTLLLSGSLLYFFNALEGYLFILSSHHQCINSHFTLLSTSEYEKEKLQERLARISGGVAVIKVRIKGTIFDVNNKVPIMDILDKI